PMLPRTVLGVVTATALLIMASAFPVFVLPPGFRSARAQAVAKGAPKAGAPTADADSRSKDRAAVRAAMQGFVKAFESRDGRAVRGWWVAGGEFRNVDGVVVGGRDALEKSLTALFARTPEVAAEVRPEPVRFLSNDAAVEEGTATVRRGRVEPDSHTRYRALLLREGGHWLPA